MSIATLVEMSNRYGADESYVLAGGGNTSWKDGDTLFVKGSGVSLADISAGQFVAMDLNKLTAMLNKTYPAADDAREAEALADILAARLPGEETKRPSVEAILHALFPHRYVLHLHPALVNGLSCSRGGGDLCRRLFGDKVVWVPLTKPGYILAAVCSRAFGEHQAKTGRFPQAAILQNHGLFVAADRVEEIDALTEEIMVRLREQIQSPPDDAPADFDIDAACRIAPVLRMLYSGDGHAAAVFHTDRETRAFLESDESIAPLLDPFTPDHIVYCKAAPLVLSPDEDCSAAFRRFEREHGYAPKIAAVKGLGFFALGRNKRDAETARLLFLDAIRIAVYARGFGGPLPLPDDFTRFILSWEAESYRQKAALSGGEAGRLAGKIAIVTGSAQGFGRGIAEAMAAEGASVVVADLNLEGARACAAELEAQNTPGCAVAVAADVSDEASVQAMVQAAVLHYGGLDILVSNAGIAIAGDLSEMTKEKFELVTAVNYTGYFLCAKHAVRPMKLQRSVSPGYTMDVIEINSKSGLAGSNKNFAYAGSKFGGVGLTQSFALELVEHGIKVNAVCPGNLLDGPLWSDPEKGLFRQYFEAGKVPGAQSVEDVRRFYESKVPMGRGCTTLDVARAIFYLVEQQYETGQALPVTGGQIMLK